MRRLDLAGRLVIAGAAGSLSVAIVLALLTITGIEWNRTSVLVSLAVVAVSGIAAVRRKTAPVLSSPRASVLAAAAIGVFALILGYGLLTARISSGDLHFFWGPKSILFFQSGGVTLSALKSTLHMYMNPDYPLLLPLVYSWSQIVSRQFS